MHGGVWMNEQMSRDETEQEQLYSWCGGELLSQQLMAHHPQTHKNMSWKSTF